MEEEVGTNKLIYILHGWTYETSRWKRFLAELERLGFKPRLLNVPGLTAKIDRPWAIADYVRWLERKIGKRRPVILGHSNGGRIALGFTAKHPDKVSQLILIDSAGLSKKELKHRLKRELFKVIAKTGKKITQSEYLRRILYKLAGERDYRVATPLMRQTMKNLISTDLTSMLHRIKVPTLIIWGELDKTTPAKNGQLMHQLIANSKLEIIKDAGHSPQFSQPQKVAELVNQFINQP